jgi:hypothetical protein
MMPAEFNIDYEVVFQSLAAIVILSFFLERALAMLFEWKPYVNKFGGKSLKTPIAFLGACAVCWMWDFDAIGSLFSEPVDSLLGKAITAAVIAGGSKASVKLFHDVLGVKSRAQKAAAE